MNAIGNPNSDSDSDDNKSKLINCCYFEHIDDKFQTINDVREQAKMLMKANNWHRDYGKHNFILSQV